MHPLKNYGWPTSSHLMQLTVDETSRNRGSINWSARNKVSVNRPMKYTWAYLKINRSGFINPDIYMARVS